MLTRGIFIGKIVDDIATLKYQIDLRNKLGQFDLNKFCEDFFKEALNITYNYKLINLNSKRSNVPGLDLGDARKGIAFQITSQNTKAKIEDTYQAITAEQRKIYKENYILIIGNKQGSYSISKTFLKEHNFDLDKNIIDLNGLLREIVLLDIDQLETLYSLFQKEFRQVKIELEPIDSAGNFESSYYNSLEKKPEVPPKNGLKFLREITDTPEKSIKELQNVYEKLTSVPRVTREVLSIIFDKGEFNPVKQIKDKYGILPKALEKFMRINEIELRWELDILETKHLTSIEEVESNNRNIQYIVIEPKILNDLLIWVSNEGKISIRTLLNTMDFSALDEID